MSSEPRPHKVLYRRIRSIMQVKVLSCLATHQQLTQVGLTVTLSPSPLPQMRPLLMGTFSKFVLVKQTLTSILLVEVQEGRIFF